MEDTWRENQEYALRQTRICFVVMRLFRWLLALLTIVCVGMGIWWLLRGETRAPAALGMAVCGAAMWMLIGAFMKPYARTAAEIVAALNTGALRKGIQPSYGVDGKLLYQHASGIFPALCPALADPWGGLPGRGRISAGFGDRVSVAPHTVTGDGRRAVYAGRGAGGDGAGLYC